MNLGYACINLTLAEQGIFTNRGMIRRTFLEKGIQYASALALQNVTSLLRILEWNVAAGITVFRITSDLFPWASEYKLEHMPDYNEIRSILETAGKLPVRMSTHPGPFNKLGGTGNTLTNTITDLELHAQLFDLMGLDPTHLNKVNVHVGGAYGDKRETLERFAMNFKKLSSGLRKRLTVENDDKPGLYSVADLIPLREATGIPVVFDYFHHRLHPGLLTEEEAFLAAFNTWAVRPVFHFSSSRKEYEDPTCKREAHDDYVYEPINTSGRDVDIIVEAKMKELSILKYGNDFGQKK